VKRLLGTGAGLLFKGSGFYITDYRSKGYSEAAKKDTSSVPATPPSASASSESSKPAAKKPAKKD
jgi:hypothetical protein